MLSQIFHFNKVFLAAVLQNLSNSLETLLETFRIQMCWRQLLCFWAFKSCWRENYLFDALSLQLRLQKHEPKTRTTKRKQKDKRVFSSHNCFFPKPKMIAPKNFFLLLRAPTSKQERLLLQSLAGQHKHQDFFIASCCGIVNTTISTFPQFCLKNVSIGCLWGT